MNPAQERKLDRMFQERVMDLHERQSLMGGDATVVHHFHGRRHKSTRWLISNGIPLTHDQHMAVHDNPDAKKRLESVMASSWLKDLEKRKNVIAKYIDYNTVVEHLNGKIEYYV
uniref:Uncharacterized protein n=1 Tax=uncultured marine virus TaxID=186617 RepID=A0A0F7L694_9VIRU|nr:hypothetical protein [uncultured marine virus]